MSVIYLNQIRKKLEADYCPLIDMADSAGQPKAQRDKARLSRALAAFALAERLDLTPAVAAAATAGVKSRRSASANAARALLRRALSRCALGCPAESAMSIRGQ